MNKIIESISNIILRLRFEKKIYLSALLLLAISMYLVQIDVLFLSSNIITPSKLIDGALSEWSKFWLLLLIGSLFYCFVVQYLFLPFFKLRLKWSNSDPEEIKNINQIYYLLNFIYSIPVLTFLILATAFLSSYSVYMNCQICFISLNFILGITYYFLSYKIVTIIFGLKINKSRFWFFILPLLFHSWLIVSFISINVL